MPEQHIYHRRILGRTLESDSKSFHSSRLFGTLVMFPCKTFYLNISYQYKNIVIPIYSRWIAQFHCVFDFINFEFFDITP